MSISAQVETQDQGSTVVAASGPVAQTASGGRDLGIPAGVGDLPDRVKKLLSDGVLDELLAGVQGEEEIVGPGGLLSQLTKRLVERARWRSS